MINKELVDVLTTLRINGIRFAIYSGYAVSVLTNNRVPTDVDILIDKRDIDKVRKIFKDFKEISEKGGYINAVFISLKGEIEIELAADIRITIDNHTYNFDLSDLSYQHILKQRLVEINTSARVYQVLQDYQLV